MSLGKRLRLIFEMKGNAALAPVTFFSLLIPTGSIFFFYQGR